VEVRSVVLNGFTSRCLGSWCLDLLDCSVVSCPAAFRGAAYSVPGASVEVAMSPAASGPLRWPVLRQAFCGCWPLTAG